jgi:hypothetical protein
MPRPRRSFSSENEVMTEGEMDRTTIFIPRVLHANLDRLATRTGEAKAVLIRQAVAELVRNHGLNPYQSPLNAEDGEDRD